MKLWVPSMGSMYQRTAALADSRALLLADEAVVREGGRDRSRDQPLDGLVGLRSRTIGRAWHHLEVAPEVAQGDLVGRVAGGRAKASQKSSSSADARAELRSRPAQTPHSGRSARPRRRALRSSGLVGVRIPSTRAGSSVMT